MLRFSIALIAACFLAGPVLAVDWVIDREETFVLIDVSYLAGGQITIRFDDVDGDIEFDPKRPAQTKAHIVVASGSARTGLRLLDPVVKGGGFLNVRSYPTIEFTFDGLEQTGPSDAVVRGRIAILGTVRPLIMQARVVRFRPVMPNLNNRVVSFDLFGQVDRREFGNTTQSGLIGPDLPLRVHLSLRPAQ